tara:strand:- start:193 stop:609 length:417 start_codon:yes stop_codon:yes gene_type:complete
MRTMVLRGVVSAQSVEQIMMFDSNAVDYGWKIVDFRIGSNNSSGLSDFQAGAAIGSTPEQFTFEDWDESTMIAVATISAAGNANLLLDYDHIIVSGLWLSNLSGDHAVNYMVVLEEMKVTPEENIMYQLKERAQSSLL